MLSALYVLSILAVLQGVVALMGGLRHLRYVRTARLWRGSGPWPRAVVFCPCKGDNEELAKNVRTLLHQDYPQYRVVFIVESTEDKAYGVLHDLGLSGIVVAGEAEQSGQKVYNLIHGVRRFGSDAEVFAFCDADARFPQSWLRDLVSPLDGPGVGASTGYRWYVPSDSSLPTLLRSAWNASIVSLLGPHGRNFAWGGSMAIRRDIFERVRVPDYWEGAVSDDYTLTRAVRDGGLDIVYVPSCLVPSYGECTWAELIEFTTRQMTITRVYSPGLWTMGLIAQSIFNLVFFGLPVLFHDNMAFALWMTIYGLAAAKSWVRLLGVRTVLSDSSLWKYAWFYLFSPPLVSLLYQYNLLCSMFCRNIVWRGIQYRLVSTKETRVCRLSENSSGLSKD